MSKVLKWIIVTSRMLWYGDMEIYVTTIYEIIRSIKLVACGVIKVCLRTGGMCQV
jgi:hypothetical protein